MGLSSDLSGVKGLLYSKTLKTLDPQISLLCLGTALIQVTTLTLGTINVY